MSHWNWVVRAYKNGSLMNETVHAGSASRDREMVVIKNLGWVPCFMDWEAAGKPLPESGKSDDLIWKAKFTEIERASKE